MTDFCLATFYELDNESHAQNSGSLKYMAPEVMRGTKYNKSRYL
jgi:serine/threonine protein kinase